jgi:nicotinate-nucleotide adenylyltransferase
MRLGLLGGTFDPVHLGHLLLAECCREQLRLDRVLFLPAAVPPHKRDRQLTPAAQRIEMLELAIAGQERFAVSRWETDRGGVSYTVDTLRHFRQEDPEGDLFLLMGADMLQDLPHWHEAENVCQLAIVAVVRRPETRDPDFTALAAVASPQRIELFRRHQVEMPAIGLCSTGLRRRVAAGQSIRYQTPPAVERYIQSQALYHLSSEDRERK